MESRNQSKQPKPSDAENNIPDPSVEKQGKNKRKPTKAAKKVNVKMETE